MLTILLVVVALGALAYPAKDLRIALPNNGTAAEGTPARVTYDLIDEQFGVGYNGPLIISATIVGSDDPLGVMDGIADELRALPGVASVPLSTPNENAEVGIVQVIPTGAPDSEETKDLVLRIRAMHDHFLRSTTYRSTSPASPRWRSTSPTVSVRRCCRSASWSSVSR